MDSEMFDTEYILMESRVEINEYFMTIDFSDVVFWQFRYQTLAKNVYKNTVYSNQINRKKGALFPKTIPHFSHLQKKTSKRNDPSPND